MFFHHLKIAFRNLRKYKTQNIISIIGLAVGFTCFAFSALWIRYEMSYDNFHPNADRIYLVRTVNNATGIIYRGSMMPVDWLTSNMPEIEAACATHYRFEDHLKVLYIDKNFSKVFDALLPEDFFMEGQTNLPVAVTEDRKGDIEFIQEKLNMDVRAIIPRWPANTNYPFDIVAPINGGSNNFILVKPGVNMETLKKKMTDFVPPGSSDPVTLVLIPLKQLRYNDPSVDPPNLVYYIKADIKFGHLRLFAIAGLLVILCSMFNHLTLYVTRIRMRLHELALRKVSGATDWQIAATLYTDFLLTILLSLVAGFLLMSWLLPTYKEFAAIGNSNINIYTELLLYAALLLVCGFIVGGIPVLYFRKQVLNEHIKGHGSPGSRNLFRKGSLLVQLIISLGMMFCATVFVKQVRFLHQTDLGIDRLNVASVEIFGFPLTPPYVDRIKQIPGIADALSIRANTVALKDLTNGNFVVRYPKDGEEVSFTCAQIHADAYFFDFFGIQFIEGRGLSNEFISSSDRYSPELSNPMVINETAKKELGDAVEFMNVVGVVQDYYLTPTTEMRPTVFYYPDPERSSFYAIIYRYEKGYRQQTEEAVRRWLLEEFADKPPVPRYTNERVSDRTNYNIIFRYMEDIFDEHFKSDWALQTILSIMTLACILIAVFGVYSLTSLSCQQRRKDIAIRKINGAEVLDIMNIFFKEYLILLALAALVAFPAGFIVMKNWLEGYVKQTSMDAWLYVLIFLLVCVVIVFSIVSMVWKAANRNPAEVVKSE